MNIRETNFNKVAQMQIERSKIERLQKVIDELYDLRLTMHLDPKQQIKIEASIKRTEELYEEQYNFVKAIEKKVLKEDFEKRNGNKYTDRDNIIKLK